MEFYSSSKKKRPIWLCESTRKFAYESLNHKYGLDTKKTPCVTLDHIEDFDQMTELEKYDAAIKEIVTKAPIRICENEKISGARFLELMDENYDPENDKENEESATEETTGTVETKTEETVSESTDDDVNITENPVPSVTEDVIEPNDKTEE